LKNIKILGIETSCDETAASVVQSSLNSGDRILSNVVFSQIEEHKEYGGVVPELAARAHLQYLTPTIHKALQDAKLTITDIDGIAVTSGPGLIGGVLVGLMAAKSIALAVSKPLFAINHLEGHALTPRLSNDVEFPYLLLLASGGHCQFLEVKSLSNYKLLGETIDDAAGEAFDKVAKLLGLGHPGGPLLEKSALNGDAKRFDLPRPLRGRHGCDMSFSGLKTAARTLIQNLKDGGGVSDKDISDISASFQKAVTESIIDRAERAIGILSAPVTSFVVAGGVAANQCLRSNLSALCQKHGLQFVAPPVPLCTDNAAMIAWAGVEHFLAGHRPSDLSIAPRPRWPLSELGE